MVDNGGIWDEQSFRDFEINRDKDTIKQLETELADKDRQLADAKAEIERLNKSLGDSLDTIFAMLLAARGAECDIDTLQAEMKPVSSKPNEYIKHIIAERDKLIEH